MGDLPRLLKSDRQSFVIVTRPFPPDSLSFESVLRLHPWSSESEVAVSLEDKYAKLSGDFHSRISAWRNLLKEPTKRLGPLKIVFCAKKAFTNRDLTTKQECYFYSLLYQRNLKLRIFE